jgi:deoxyribonuclease IV
MVTKKKSHLLLGAHMSISGGFEKAIERGTSIGCTTIQIFTKSNRQWHAKPISQEEADLFRKAVKDSDIHPIVAHATYLINIGSPDKTIESKSIKAVIDELQRCTILGIPYLVLHPGSHVDTDEATCLERIAHNLDKIFEADSSNTKILLETMAGQGSSVCYSFDQIATIRNLSSQKARIGVCFDTCHAFVAGYDFTTPHGYKTMWADFDSIIGLNHLYAIHVNDSKKGLGSYVDRHEEIGKGVIGLEAFKLLFNDSRFFDIPKILETPKGELEDDLRNMQTIRSLLSEATTEKLNITD